MKKQFQNSNKNNVNAIKSQTYMWVPVAELHIDKDRISHGPWHLKSLQGLTPNTMKITI